MPAKVEVTPALPGLSPVASKPIIARFDGGRLSSDGGVLALREIEARLGLADRLAACVADPRMAGRTLHGVAEIMRIRMLMIAAGYEDGNDADSLRHDPAFKLALGRLPDGAALCSQPTISRLENLPRPRDLLRMGQAMVELYCASFRHVPRRITLDIDDTFDAVHGGQQLRLFNAHYDDYGFQPIVVFDGEGRPVAAMLRPARRPTGREVRGFLRRLVREIRGHWPRVEILLRADSHYCAPEVLDVCRAERVDFILGVATTSTLLRHVETLERSTAARQGAGLDKLRRYKEFYDGAASWTRVERIIARVESQPQDVLASGTTMQWDTASKSWQAGAVMQDSSLNRRQTVRLGAGVAFAQIGIIGFDGQIELEALRLYGLPEDAPAVLYGCPSLPAGTRTLAVETSWDLPSLGPGATANADVTVTGARRGDFADASLDTSSIAFVLDCHVWSNNSVRVTARNVSASTVDLAAAPLAVQVVKRRLP